jgi:transcriptional regulator with XRE-family HTH domain
MNRFEVFPVTRTSPESPFLLALGKAIRLIRTEREMSQSLLAERSGIHATWISHIESGRINPTVLNLNRLSEGLGIRLSDLAARSEELEKS